MRHQLLLLTLLLGCARSASTPEPRAASSAPHAPLEVSFRVVSEDAGALNGLVVLQPTAGFRTPVDIRLDVPPEALLVGTSPALRVVPDGSGQELTVPVALRYGATPAHDLKVTASAIRASSGVTATTAYRFGRAEPMPQTPRRTGPSRHVGQTEVGPAIPL